MLNKKYFKIGPISAFIDAHLKELLFQRVKICVKAEIISKLNQSMDMHGCCQSKLLLDISLASVSVGL